MKNRYDVIVVGAGPAGSVAARRAAQAGLDTLLLEKRPRVGYPVRCAEAVGADSTRAFIDLDERWIDTHITRFAVHNSRGASVKVPPTEPTLVVDRKLFDLELSHLAQEAGADLRTHASAVGLIIEDGFVRGVKTSLSGKEYALRSRLVVAADGSEGQVTRWAGWKSLPPLEDYYIGAEYLLDGLDGQIEVDVCQYHLNRRLAPGGYLWVFPKSAHAANVGLVISADQRARVPAFDLLDQFIAEKFPRAKKRTRIAGGIPVSGTLRQLVSNGLLAVGDAAHQADPLHGGGIDLGMAGAQMAMRVAVKALSEGEATAGALRAYEKEWHRQYSGMHGALYRIRKMLKDMEQERIDRLIDKASRIPLGKLSLARIVLTVARNDPRLLLQAARLISTGLISR